MTARIISIHDAKLKTVSVGIKAMTISDRQVTLAVFRQLFDEELISYDGRLNGTPWGIVNYHPDKCEGSFHHWHIVWQKGDELRRARVNKEIIFDDFGSETADRFLETLFYAASSGVRPANSLPPVNYDNTVQFKFRDLRIEANVPRGMHRYTCYPLSREDGTLRALQNKWGPDPGKVLEDSYALLADKVDEELARRQRWQSTLKELAGLPQLFVAV